MASQVAVEASLNAPSLPNNLSDDDEHDITGKVGPIDSDDEIQEGTPRNTVEDNGLDGEDDDDDDLFGDMAGDGDEPALRKLDDEDLDSGDDDGRADRVQDTQQDAFEEQEQQTLNFMDADMARHAIPEPSDGELYLLKIPRFLSIEPTAWDHKTFEAPKVDHHSKEEKASDHFSAYNTAMTTVRWRRSPTNPAELQSNARVLRWSDGSLTLQFASDPTNQYEINSSMLAPPQVAPKIPTPTSILSKGKGAEYKESYTYLVAPYEEANVMRVTNKFTTGLFVVPTANSGDDALAKLQSDLAAAASRGRGEADEAISFIRVDEDPELQRAREEATFKEKQRQIKAREKNELRERERVSRTLGRTGARSSGYGGLSIGGLEDDEGGRRAGAPKRKPKTGLRRDWSDDEDYGIRGKTREDDYDEEDDFIARSDEEPEFEEGSDEEEILDSPPRRGGDASPKRKSGGGRAAQDSDDEVVVSRTKRRRVVEDDDEDE